MKLLLKAVRTTSRAWLFENSKGQRQWIPRRFVVYIRLEGPLPDGSRLCEARIEDWWLERHPWPKNGQMKLI